ncbi:hypothetical protein BC332_26179 [Capsicum chinense]|nr:hypothetical protein BC332_26179 [Capsicum chinense]
MPEKTLTKDWKHLFTANRIASKEPIAPPPVKHKNPQNDHAPSVKQAWKPTIDGEKKVMQRAEHDLETQLKLLHLEKKGNHEHERWQTVQRIFGAKGKEQQHLEPGTTVSCTPHKARPSSSGVSIETPGVRADKVSSIINKVMSGWSWVTNATSTVRGKIWVAWNPDELIFIGLETTEQYIHAPKSHQHLFFECIYSTSIWKRILMRRGISRPCLGWDEEIAWASAHAKRRTTNTELDDNGCNDLLCTVGEESKNFSEVDNK